MPPAASTISKGTKLASRFGIFIFCLPLPDFLPQAQQRACQHQRAAQYGRRRKRCGTTSRRERRWLGSQLPQQAPHGRIARFGRVEPLAVVLRPAAADAQSFVKDVAALTWQVRVVGQAIKGAVRCSVFEIACHLIAGADLRRRDWATLEVLQRTKPKGTDRFTISRLDLARKSRPADHDLLG